MPSSGYVDDVLRLVVALADADAIGTVTQRVPESDTPPEIIVSAYVGADMLRPAIALQQSLQLCFDAAAVAFEAASTDVANVDRDYVEMLLRERVVDLKIVHLENGSFLGRFSIDPRTPNGKVRVIAIASVAAAALAVTAVLPPTAIILTGALPSVATILWPDEKKIPLQTIDPSDITPTESVKISVSGPIYVYDIDLDGPRAANDAFLSKVHALDGVEAQSRFIDGAPENLQRLRVWSSAPLDEMELRTHATDAKTKIATIASHLTSHG